MSGYKPGAVAKATVKGVPDIRVFRTASGGWHAARGWFGDESELVTEIRPLVVLDLNESPRFPALSGSLIDLLRHLANVDPYRSFAPIRKESLEWIADQIETQIKPPRIPEPGLWGVVAATIGRDSIPHAFLRDRLDTEGSSTWTEIETGSRYAWSDLTDPALVREGVES